MAFNSNNNDYKYWNDVLFCGFTYRHDFKINLKIGEVYLGNVKGTVLSLKSKSFILRACHGI